MNTKEANDVRFAKRKILRGISNITFADMQPWKASVRE